MKLFRRLSLFWQLYITILIALLLVLCVFVFTYQRIDHYADSEDFYDDTRFLADLVNQLPPGNSDFEVLLRGMGLASYHDLKLLTINQASRYREFNKQIASFDNVSILQFPDGRLMGLYPLSSIESSDTPSVLLVSDPDPAQLSAFGQLHESANRKAEKYVRHQQNVLFYTILVSLLLSVAAGLYWQAIRIHGYLLRFLHAGEEWLAGNTSHSIDATMPSPLDKIAVHHNQLISALLKKQREQQLLFNAVSHEIRTPLSKLHLAIDLLQRDLPPDARQPMLEELANYVDELDQLTDQVLSLSKLSENTQHQKLVLSTEKICLGDWLCKRVEHWRSVYSQREFVFHATDFAANALVDINPMHSRILFDNLLENAAKYGKRRIVIEQQLQAKFVIITICDDGPGIAASYRNDILLPFFRIDESRANDTDGYGIGLAMVDIIAQHYQIDLRFDVSSRLGGLQVSLRVPLSTQMKG